MAVLTPAARRHLADLSENICAGPWALAGVVLAFAMIQGGLIIRLPLTADEALILYRLPLAHGGLPRLADIAVMLGDMAWPGLAGQRLAFLLASIATTILAMRISWLLHRSHLAAALTGLWLNLTILGGIHGVLISDAVLAAFLAALAVWAGAETFARPALINWAVAGLALSVGLLADPRVAGFGIGMMAAVFLVARLRDAPHSEFALLALLAPTALAGIMWYLSGPAGASSVPGLSGFLTLVILVSPGLFLIALAALAIGAWHGLHPARGQARFAMLTLAPMLVLWALSGFDPGGGILVLPLLIPMAAGCAIRVFSPGPARFARISTALAAAISAATMAITLYPANPVSVRFPALDRQGGWVALERSLTVEADRIGATWVASFDPRLTALLALQGGGLGHTSLRADLPRQQVDCQTMGLFLAHTDAQEAIATQFDGAVSLALLARRGAGGIAAEYHLFAVGPPVDRSICLPP